MPETQTDNDYNSSACCCCFSLFLFLSQFHSGSAHSHLLCSPTAPHRRRNNFNLNFPASRMCAAVLRCQNRAHDVNQKNRRFPTFPNDGRIVKMEIFYKIITFCWSKIHFPIKPNREQRLLLRWKNMMASMWKYATRGNGMMEKRSEKKKIMLRQRAEITYSTFSVRRQRRRCEWRQCM